MICHVIVRSRVYLENLRVRGNFWELARLYQLEELQKDDTNLRPGPEDCVIWFDCRPFVGVFTEERSYSLAYGWDEMLGKNETLLHLGVCEFNLIDGNSHKVIYKGAFQVHNWNFRESLRIGYKRLVIAWEDVIRKVDKKVFKNLGDPMLSVREKDPKLLLYTKYLSGILAKVVQKLVWFPRWVLVVEDPNGLYYRLKHPKHKVIWADPFVISNDGDQFIFFEEKSPREKGRICVIQKNQEDKVIKKYWPLIEDSSHYSYPFLFKYHDEWYMIVENSEQERIPLYRCTNWPNEWEYVKDILAGEKVADGTLLFHQDKVYLFCTLSREPEISLNDELMIYVANDLFDEFKPHPLNPVNSDVRSARPAGEILVDSNALFRPAQKTVKRYGQAIQIMRINELSPTRYNETWADEICPNPMRGELCTHTICELDNSRVRDIQIKEKRRFV